ncbi:hypothetical protein DIPPA_09778 [Diplonema papillatum]|nr:hypothetical protein DIPPA_09778 [Diplonema papillatum]
MHSHGRKHGRRGQFGAPPEGGRKVGLMQMTTGGRDDVLDELLERHAAEQWQARRREFEKDRLLDELLIRRLAGGQLGLAGPSLRRRSYSDPPAYLNAPPSPQHQRDAPVRRSQSPNPKSSLSRDPSFAAVIPMRRPESITHNSDLNASYRSSEFVNTRQYASEPGSPDTYRQHHYHQQGAGPGYPAADVRASSVRYYDSNAPSTSRTDAGDADAAAHRGGGYGHSGSDPRPQSDHGAPAAAASRSPDGARLSANSRQRLTGAGVRSVSIPIPEGRPSSGSHGGGELSSQDDNCSSHDEPSLRGTRREVVPVSASLSSKIDAASASANDADTDSLDGTKLKHNGSVLSMDAIENASAAVVSKEVFKRYDADEDGLLNKYEYGVLMKDIAHDVSPKDAFVTALSETRFRHSLTAARISCLRRLLLAPPTGSICTIEGCVKKARLNGARCRVKAVRRDGMVDVNLPGGQRDCLPPSNLIWDE